FDIDRTGHPLTIRTVDGDVEFDGTDAHHPANGAFVVGFARPTKFVTFEAGPSGRFVFENYEVQQGGLVATVYVEDFEFNNVDCHDNTCYGGTSTHTEWCLYVRSDT